MIKLEQGAVIAGLKLEMRPALIIGEKIWEQNGQPFVITSGLEGEHGAGSLHYYGYAIDVRVKFWGLTTQFNIRDRLRKELPEGFQVVFHPNHHIHIEYDAIIRGG